MDSKEYKLYHENYMSNNFGTTSQECVFLLSSVPVTVFISLWLSSHDQKILSIFFEFVIIILSVILNCTVFSEVNHLIFLNLSLITVAILLSNLNLSQLKDFLKNEVPQKKAFITNYRACTNFFSTLCILAVDFVVFPKRLAKTETFGFGLMDLGVGFFICSNGLVEKHAKTPNQFIKLIKSVSVLLFIGSIRLISVKSIDYHEHVGEYGVHWNFFFTLAACRIISFTLMTITNFANPLWLALATGAAHQMLLNFGLQEWALLDIPRNNFLTANKEGLTSCLGCVSLFFAASSIGKFVSSPKTTYIHLLKKLILLSVVIWVGYYISVNATGCSRRLVNLGYIFWVLALSTTGLYCFIFGEMFLSSSKKIKKIIRTTPLLFDSINANGLFFFLFGNLLTGLVNSIFQTLLLGKTAGVVIIVCYMIVLCSVTHYLNLKKIYLKL